MHPRVSVIVPMYNSELYIEECINSILTQTYANLELVLIDDGSIDGTFSIASKIAKRDRRIVLIHQENAGVSAARNKGISVSQGDYITFVDADDLCEPEYLEKLLALTSEDTISVCKYRKLTTDGYVDVNEHLKGYDLVSGDTLFETWLLPIFATREVLGSVCRTMFPLKIIRTNVLVFPNCIIAEDQLFLIHCLRFCRKVRVCNDPLYVYREVSNSATHQMYRKNLLSDREIYMEELKKILSTFELSADQYEYLINMAILNNRNMLFYNAEQSDEFFNEIRKVYHSQFMKNIPKEHFQDWQQFTSKSERIVARMIDLRLFPLFYFLRKIKRMITQ